MTLKTNPLRVLRLILGSDLFFPTILLLTYIIFLIIIRGVIPTPDELIQTFSALYAKYGYEIIFTAAFLESLILINLFVPGQVAMALGVIFSRTGQTNLIIVVAVAVLGAISAYSLDYLLGSFGFSDFLKKTSFKSFHHESKTNLMRFGYKGLIVGFFNTNIGAFLSLAAGTLNYPWLKFITIAFISTIFWATFWAILVYTFGNIFLEVFRKYSFLFIFIIFGGIFISRLWKKK